MRMWMVNPQLMCNKHLLGEHGELHKFLHNWVKHHKIDGRISGNAMNHRSPLEQPDFSYLPVEQQNYRVDKEQSLLLLHTRCEACHASNP